MRVHTKPHVVLALSGMSWLLVGISLNLHGLFLLVTLIGDAKRGSPLTLKLLEVLGDIEKVVLSLICAALLLGLIKARLIFFRVVKKVVKKILFSGSASPLKTLFTFRYFLIIGLMIGLGRFLSWLDVPPDIRGVLNVAVGTGLIIGSFLYFSISFQVAKRTSPHL